MATPQGGVFQEERTMSVKTHGQAGDGCNQQAESQDGFGIVNAGKWGGRRGEQGQIIKGLTGCEWSLNAFWWPQEPLQGGLSLGREECILISGLER